MLVKAQAAATAARRLKRKVEEEEEELANLAVKIIERADQVEVLRMEPCLSSFSFVQAGGKLDKLSPEDLLDEKMME